jgi:hypothetical protein
MSYPVLFDVTPPARHDRLQILVRLLVSIILGIIGVSLGWLLLVAYFALPVVAAVAIGSHGVEHYFARTAPAITRILRWLLSFEAYMAFLTDRFPTGEDSLVEYRVTPAGAPTAADALWRLAASLPEALILAVLGWVAGIVWLISLVFVLVRAAVPDGLLGFQRGLLRWQARLFAYHAAMVDVAPPYALDTGHEPTRA